MRAAIVCLVLVVLATQADGRPNACTRKGLTGAALSRCELNTYIKRPGCTVATSYGNRDGLLGKPVSAGGVLDRHTATIAHRTLPLGSTVTLSYRGRTVVAKVTDRGPVKAYGADVDLGPAAGRALGIEGESACIDVMR